MYAGNLNKSVYKYGIGLTDWQGSKNLLPLCDKWEVFMYIESMEIHILGKTVNDNQTPNIFY